MQGSRTVRLLMPRAAYGSAVHVGAVAGTLPAVRVDLRSDTVTKPTPAMLDAMCRAPVGDDVFGDDPTVAALEQRIAEACKLPAAVFVPSGTMANQLALAASIPGPLHSFLCHTISHVNKYECGASAFLARAHLIPVQPKSQRFLDWESDIKPACLDSDIHHAPTTLVALENTMNGMVQPVAEFAAVADHVRAAGMRVHLDGARLWNAAVHQGVSLDAYTRHVSSVSLCFSKGLGAPVGSCLVSDAETVGRARRIRKAVGGGMRQAGVLAAAGLHAMDHHWQRMSIDHANAALFGAAAQRLGLLNTVFPVETNMVFLLSPDPQRINLLGFATHARRAGFLLLGGAERMRIVFHLQVSREQTEELVRILEEWYASVTA
jgi:threonine aldolase